MKQHVIIAKVDDHGTSTIYKKVCRSKSGALRESRELDSMNLIRRFEYRMVKLGNGCVEWEFIPRSEIRPCKYDGKLMSMSSSSDCSVVIHVEDMDGNIVNLNQKGGCHDFDVTHFCEVREDCNCDAVWPELERRGFVRA